MTRSWLRGAITTAGCRARWQWRRSGWQFPVLHEDDLLRGGVEWVRSPVRRRVTAAFGTVTAAAWLTGVVSAIVSWHHDTVLAEPVALAGIGAFTIAPAMLWLAGNLFRLLGIHPTAARYNPVSRLNLTMNLMLLGLVRPTRRSVATVVLIVTVTITVAVIDAHLGAAATDTRVHGGALQTSDDSGYTWTTVSAARYRDAREQDLRNSAALLLVGDGIATLAMLGFHRLPVRTYGLPGRLHPKRRVATS